jgi:hypothetical protein
MNFKTIMAGIPALFAKLGTDAINLGNGIITFLETAGPSGLVVVTDVLTDVATKSVTPAQALSQLQDVHAFNTAAAAAIVTIQADNLAAETAAGPAAVE